VEAPRRDGRPPRGGRVAVAPSTPDLRGELPAEIDEVGDCVLPHA
jgi:hypothetical protein